MPDHHPGAAVAVGEGGHQQGRRQRAGARGAQERPVAVGPQAQLLLCVDGRQRGEGGDAEHGRGPDAHQRQPHHRAVDDEGAPPRRSARMEWELSARWRPFSRYRSIQKNEAATSSEATAANRKGEADPRAAIIRPARTGPNRRVVFQAVACSEAALEMSALGTISVMKAWRTGHLDGDEQAEAERGHGQDGQRLRVGDDERKMAADRAAAKSCARTRTCAVRPGRRARRPWARRTAWAGRRSR